MKKKLPCVFVATTLYFLTAASAPVVYDRGSDYQNVSHGSAKGSYSVVIVGDKLKVTTFLETSRQGVAGTTYGHLGFALFDASGKPVWTSRLDQSVGADALRGKKHKRSSKAFTVFGPPAAAVIKNGGSIAFDVWANGNMGGWGSPSEFMRSAEGRIKEANELMKTLTPGQQKVVNGWMISKLPPAASAGT